MDEEKNTLPEPEETEQESTSPEPEEAEQESAPQESEEAGQERVSQKKQKKEKKRIYTEGRADIRYRGPLSYRVFKILGWICIVLTHVVILMRLDIRLDPTMTPVLKTPIGILSSVSSMSLPLLLFANFALILNASEGYHKQLIRYFLSLSGVAALAIFVYERYLVDSAAVLLGDREMGESAVQMIFRMAVPSGYVAFNIFVDLFLCALLMFFMYYRPKHVFKGKALTVFRLFSVIPILYEIASFVLKLLSIEGKITIPVLAIPFLTVKPPVTFLVFIILVLYIKNRERRFLKHDRSLEDYQRFLQTNRNSFHFSRFSAIVLALAGLFDALCLVAGIVIIWLKDPEMMTKTAEAVNRLNDLGIGQSLALLLLSPVMLLFSYTRKYEHRIVDSFIPIVGLGAIALVYVEGLYQFVYSLPMIISYLSGR